MAKSSYTAARSRTQVQAGLPGGAAPPIFQLKLFKSFSELGLIEIQATVWDDVGQEWIAFNAWTEERVVDPNQIFVIMGAVRRAATAYTTSGDLLLIETVPLVGIVEVWIPPAQRQLSTTDGWVASGLKTAFQAAPIP